MWTIDTTRELFSLIRETLDNNLDHLNLLDSAVGDGDHGYTVQRAFTAAEVSVLELDEGDCGQQFDVAAAALAENAGGAIGPILAAMFAEGGVVFKGKSTLDTQDLAAFFAGGFQAIMEIGGAKPGEKTMLDALAPAVKMLNVSNEKPMSAALQAAIAAAVQGARETAQMVAKQGRARFVGERSKGFEEAGANSMVLILQAFLDAAQGDKAARNGMNQERLESTGQPSGKLINHPADMVTEDNEGLASAYPQLVRLTSDGILIRSTSKEPGKVGLAIGHGGGHTPSMGGFVGPGLLDADAYGPIFTCASGVKIGKAIEAADHGAGVALLVSNHAGDVLNSRLGVRRAQQQGIAVESILLGDDIATAPRDRMDDRRGLGGMLFALKIGGGAAEAGCQLEEVARLMRKTNERTASLAVAVRPPTHPATGNLLFKMPDGQIEIGTGVHGEVGVYRGELLPADAVIDLLMERLLSDLEGLLEQNLLVFLNGSGGTSKMELHILYRRVAQILKEKNIAAVGVVVDSLFTTQEMGGFSLSLCAVDRELMQWWHQKASGASFHSPLAD